ncbi:hypothetical protein DJ93_855 [Bacillus clarus]|uniref:Uncharacterized protein n=1 Tax=Bacillus clarus TaxID=2338372 RepID=A0A090YN75_9BACI|nr:hypothetical protein DJ93_855 [Bacillus clarus]
MAGCESKANADSKLQVAEAPEEKYKMTKE